MSFERHRFKTREEDYRPVIFPPPGPWWCSGCGGCDEDSYSTTIATFPKGTNLLEYWPEAEDIETEIIDEITYTSRFPKPDWM